MKTHLGHYEIVSELGRGGMGVVYKAFEPALNRHVAIKELSPSLAHDPQLVERFLREARSMAALSDPHIIQIFYIGTDEATSQPFFAMEYVEGDSLSAILKRDGKFSVDNALKVLHQTAQGLATAHDHGVIHRDIKPGNLMLTQRGQVKVADFGIALATTDISKKLTSTGEFVGTPGYLSPEVCLGKPVDQRSDIFSLGIVLFEMLSGRIPFGDESPLGLMLEVVKAEIPNIQELNGEVDASTAAILARMVAKEPEDRFQSCQDLIAALEAHPVLSHGDTVKLMRPVQIDAATMIGTPAPKSAARAATPPPVVRSGSSPLPAPAQLDTQPTRPSVLERPPSRSGRWLPLTVAAVLILSVAGGAFAFRTNIMDFARGFGDGFTGSRQVAYDAGRNTGQASNPVGTSMAAESATSMPSTGETIDTDVAVSTTAMPSAASSLMSEAEINAAIEQDRATTSGSSMPVETVALAANDPVSSNLGVSDASDVSAPAMAASAASTAQTSAMPTSSATTAAAPQAKAVASAAPPRPVAAPVPQRVAVIALGDSGISGPARSRIERELRSAGFDLVDAEALGVSVDDGLANALNAVRRAATIAVVVRAEPVGSEQLKFYGRTSEMYVANLTVRAYKTADRASIGTSLSEKVQFTTLNADTQADAALKGKLDRLVSELSPYRGRG